MPMTMRPSEMSCRVAPLASTVGSRVPGFVTQWPSFIVVVACDGEREQREGLLPEDVGVVRPAVLEAVRLGELDQLDEAARGRVGQTVTPKLRAICVSPLLGGRAIIPLQPCSAQGERGEGRQCAIAAKATRPSSGSSNARPASGRADED